MMKKDKDGCHKFDSTGINREFIVDTIDIENSGGDW